MMLRMRSLVDVVRFAEPFERYVVGIVRASGRAVPRWQRPSVSSVSSLEPPAAHDAENLES